MAGHTAGFLAERLAKATAIPAEQRSADVRAFIETCRLQAELAEELGLPEFISAGTDMRDWMGRWSAAPALKLVRSFLVSPSTGPLIHAFPLHRLAMIDIFNDATVQIQGTGYYPLDLGRELTALLEREPRLETLAILAAGLPGVVKEDPVCRRGLIRMANSVVALLRRPAVRRRLQSELAALPHQLISHEDLLVFFLHYASRAAVDLVLESGTGAISADTMAAIQLAAELLPQLAPDNPRFRYEAAIMAKCSNPGLPEAACRTRYLTMLPDALDVARQQGSDCFIAQCGYILATGIEDWIEESSVRQGLPPPSAVLGWLQEARAAHRRCKDVLPMQWTSKLDGEKALTAELVKASLQHLQQQGDRWRPLTPAVQQDLHAALHTSLDKCKDLLAGSGPGSVSLEQKLACHGCGKFAPQLRKCGACKEAQYCSVDCQKAHWKEHRPRCKEVQAAKAAASGAAS